ncbi:putative PTS system [Listeria monocytogenes]|nr:putative PTS system [Listeria monocytogenes]
MRILSPRIRPKSSESILAQGILSSPNTSSTVLYIYFTCGATKTASTCSL